VYLKGTALLGGIVGATESIQFNKLSIQFNKPNYDRESRVAINYTKRRVLVDALFGAVFLPCLPFVLLLNLKKPHSSSTTGTTQPPSPSNPIGIERLMPLPLSTTSNDFFIKPPL
jgi:hypothetical protein